MGLNNIKILVCVWILFVSVVADKQGEPELMGAEDKRQQGDEQDCVKMSDTSWPEYGRQAEDHQVQFLLLTRSNIDCVELFNQESLSETKKSYFDVSRPTKVIVHGYSAMGNRPSWVKKLAKTLLRVQDVNVLVVDWLHIASRAYNRVVENYKDVSLQISVLINRLQEHGCELESFHFICLSLGSHVAGFVGTLFEGQIGKITALDPAGPMFKGADVYDRLDPSDARFVEAIHSDADYFGISIPVGHVDFFLNGGKDQTGCTRKSLSSLSGYVFCDHMRALYVYMSSLESSCPLHGIPCSSYEDFLKGLCVDCEDFNGKCPTIGPSENAGIVVSPIPKEQKLYLLTTSQPPYCAHHILLKLEVSALIKSAEVEVSLRTDDQESKQRIRMKKDTTEYRMVLAHPVPLCQIHFIEMKNTGSRFYRQAEVHFQSVCVSEFPSLSQDLPICVNNFNVRRGAPWSHDFVQVC